MIAIATLSNDELRDWPRAHFERLIDMFIERTDQDIVLLGSPEQRQAINLLARTRPAQRVINASGQPWPKVLETIQKAKLVIANNSGIAHVAASLGQSTLCLFAASHDPHEWGPRGPKATTLYVRTACSPCAMATVWGCPNGHACMVKLTPEVVFDAAQRMLEQ